MSVFIPPAIKIDKIEDLKQTKEYLRDLNKKIRYLSENIDVDNFAPEEYRRLYSNGTKATELSHDLEEFHITVENYDTDIRARLKQMAAEIDLLVSKGDATNQINISTEKIRISGNHLIVQSDNFSLDESGNLSMQGEINAQGGYFGGFQITDGGYLADGSGTIKTADLSGTDINTVDLDITTDTYIDGCSIDFSNCTVKTTQKTYWGWFYTQDVNVSGTVFGNCASASVVECSGNISCYDYWSDNEGIAYSDARLKEDVESIDKKEALEFLMKLRPVSYQLRDEEGVHYGLIAQEILETGDPYKLVYQNEDGYYSVRYGLLHAVIAAAMQEQITEMEEVGVGL